MGWGIGDLFSGNPLKKLINLPNKVVGEGVAAIAGRDSWLGRRGAAFGEATSGEGGIRGMASDFLSSQMGGVQHIQRNRAADKSIAAEDRAKAQAGADAAVRQAEYEEQSAAGTERIRAKRRKGFQSTVLTDASPATLGSSGTGKTLLGD